MIAKQTVYLSEDRSEAVPEGDPKAKFLLVREGQEIDDKIVEEHDCASLVNSAAKHDGDKPKHTGTKKK